METRANMSHEDVTTLQARLESAEQEANRLRSIVAGYEQMDTMPPPVARAMQEHGQRIENLESKVDSVITYFEAHKGTMERVVEALQSEPRCSDCPRRGPLSLVPSQRGG